MVPEQELLKQLNQVLKDIDDKITEQRQIYRKQKENERAQYTRAHGGAIPQEEAKKIDDKFDTKIMILLKAGNEISSLRLEKTEEPSLVKKLEKAEKIMDRLSSATKDLEPSNRLAQAVNRAINQIKDIGKKFKDMFSIKQEKAPSKDPYLKTGAYKVSDIGKAMLTGFRKSAGLAKPLKTSPEEQGPAVGPEQDKGRRGPSR